MTESILGAALRAASKSKDCCYNPDSPGHDRPGPGTVLKNSWGLAAALAAGYRRTAAAARVTV